VQHHQPHARPADGSRLWRDSDGVHVDLRGLPPAEAMTTVLRALESREAAVVVGHFEGEPIDLYAELEERGWTHETVASHCGSADCENGFMLRMVRWG
jgi:hypothetical protein